MDFEWNEAKNATNRMKHHVDFSLVHVFDWDNAIVEPDTRFDYGEERFLARGYALDGVGYSIVFTFRGPVVRIISIREFNKKEERRYGRQPE
ncbi:MAG: BrnT family toxin [Candidatus Devosia phytovorans]|uniref:BrnT family toxin n=1 Tax=Candidatus Devosia phytovorans TaxID=3121372 RepID=A0AAJ6AZZ3_9HYPH|nr:BrnT family toxin [Devosia sp.]WEK04326.1 MAG: BrnT family toxin [Devosia sp.]